MPFQKHTRAAAERAAKESFSPAELAQRWNCCRQSIYNAINSGELHSFKFRSRRLIPLSEIERIERGGA